MLNDAAAQGRRALYVCYNRPLADRIAQIAPKEAEVANFHQLCERRIRAEGETVDFRQPGVFDAIAAQMAELPVRPGDEVDELIIDEGQDFEQAWVKPLLSRVRSRGKSVVARRPDAEPLRKAAGRPPGLDRPERENELQEPSGHR